MIAFLKETTFAANDVLKRSVGILKNHYFSIAGLCLLLFIILQSNTMLTLYFSDTAFSVRLFFLGLFSVLVISTTFVLLRYSIHLVRNEKTIPLTEYFPSVKQFASSIVGILIVAVLFFVMIMVLLLLGLPLVYMGVEMDTIFYRILPPVAAILLLIGGLRIIFYPFFILDLRLSAVRAMKFSVAMTKGNVSKLLLTYFIVTAVQVLQFALEYFGYNVISIIFKFVNAFFILPMLSIILSVFYVEMMKEYHGGDDPSLMDNLI